MKNKSLYLLILILIIVIITVTSRLAGIPSQSEYYKKTYNEVKNQSFEGSIIKKYIDNNHARRKLVVKGKSETTIDLYYENSRFFNFFQVGDELIKYKDSLFFIVRRENLDTIMNITFSNIKKDN